MIARLKDALLAALIAGVLTLPLMGARTIESAHGLTAEWHLDRVLAVVVTVFLGRLAVLALLRRARGLGRMFSQISAWVARSAKVFSVQRRKKRRLLKTRFALPAILILATLLLPLMPFSSRYVLDVGIMVLTYIMLAWGLNITVGYAGLLDLGYVAFYAIGAYSYALLAQYADMGFWAALPLCGLIAAAVGVVLGFPVLRLRGDYFAIVTLGFGEITRLILINWTTLTGGPNGLSGVPRPRLFGMEFARSGEEGQALFHDVFGLAFDPSQRVVFLYYIILGMALLVGWFSWRLRRLPLGRAWEALREDEVACAALGVNRWWVKLTAYALAASVAGLGGAFFAARQGFISPESFTFMESATILAIIILGGMGSLMGVVLATLFIIGLPELFRDLEQFRMLAFGLGMVLVMIWRPGGLMSAREPTVRL